MILSFDDALDGPLEWRDEISGLAAEIERSDLLEIGTVEASGELRAVDGGFLLDGSLEYDQSLACARCLEPALERIVETFEVFLVRRAPRIGDGAQRGDGSDRNPDHEEYDDELELEADDLSVVAVQGDEVDTRDFVVEQVVLNLPTRALCRKDCAGLCPTCGADRNRVACGCEPAGDPRWGALAALRAPSEH